MELTALRFSLFFEFEPRHRFGALRRLAIGMEGKPPRSLKDALAFTSAALLEFTWMANYGGLSGFSLSEGAAKLRPAFTGVELPPWKPPFPHCAGARRSKRRKEARPPTGGEEGA